MKRKEFILGAVIVTALLGLFFNQVFLYGKIPFPGDLLTAEYQPWRSESFMGYNPGSIPNKAQYPDTIRQLYPWRTLATSVFKSGQIPFWNPYNFSGTPLLANFQSAVFYPLSWLSLILPQIWSWAIMVILQPFLALIFTYLYCRKLKLSIASGWLAAVTYAFCAFSAVWLEYNTITQVTAWLPLALLAIENLKEKTSVGWSVIFSLALALALLAGHPQVFSYLLIFSLIYAWFRLNNLKKFLKVSFFSVVGIGISAIQLIPGLELILQSARSPHPVDIYLNKILIQPWQLIMAIVPDFFGNPATRNYWPLDTYVGKVTSVGIVGLILALISLKLFKKDHFVKFFSLGAVIILLLITSNPLTAFLYRLPLPFFSSSSPTLMTYLLAFCFAVLSAFGLNALQKGNVNGRNLITVLATFLAIFALLWAATFILPKLMQADWADNLLTGRRVLLQQTVIFLASGALLLALLKYKSRQVIFLFIALQVFELFLGFRKFNPFVTKELVFPETSVFNFLKSQNSPGRFWGVGAADVEANFATQINLYSPGGYDPLYPKRYGELIQSAKDGKIRTDFTDQTRSDANISPTNNDVDLSSNLYRLKILDLLGVKYVLDRNENALSEKGFTPDRFQPIWKDHGWTVYQNLKALPRFFLAANYEIYKNPANFGELFFKSNFDPRQTVLIEKPLVSNLLGSINGDSVKLINYQPDAVMVQTNSNGNRLLFLSDTYYPGWHAYVDGIPTEILRADYAFRAVVVPAGNHTVSFIFRSESFTIGTVISLMSILIAGLFILKSKIKIYV